MARNLQLYIRRNVKIAKHFQKLCIKHPQWRIGELIKETANVYDLSPKTVEGILTKKWGEDGD